MIEIRLHGRGGLGAKTAGLQIAKSALETGKQVQAFPEFTAARQGAPVKVFVRISNTEIKVHSAVYNPQYIVIFDPALITKENLEGANENTIIIANTKKQKPSFSIKSHFKPIDATKIALEETGKPITNSVMLGAFAKAFPELCSETLKKHLHLSLEKKYGKELADKKIKAFERAYKELQ